MSTNHVIISGANGFLGSALSVYLQSKGWRVTGVCRKAPNSPLQGVDYFISSEYSSEDMKRLFTITQATHWVHLAGSSSVQQSLHNPLKSFESGPSLLARMLDCLGSKELATVFVSSAAVYGNPGVLPIHENLPPQPISHYGLHKWMSELILAQHGVPHLSARVFSAFGPCLRKQILWDLCQKLSQGGEVCLSGTGQETRDFIHVEDVCYAIETLLNKGNFDGSAYNIASGQETSVRELAEACIYAWGTDSQRLKFSGHQRQGDPVQWRACIEKIMKLGFTPKRALQEAVTDYVNWFKQQAS